MCNLGKKGNVARNWRNSATVTGKLLATFSSVEWHAGGVRTELSWDPNLVGDDNFRVARQIDLFGRLGMEGKTFVARQVLMIL